MSSSTAQLLKPESCRPPSSLWRIDLFLLTMPTAAILITSGALKVVDVTKSNSIQLAIAAAEIGCGLCVVWARRSPYVQVGLLSLASAFAGASLLGLATNTDCDCFGEFDVKPVDRLLIAALLFISALLHLTAPLRVPLLGIVAGAALLLGAASERFLHAVPTSATPIEEILPPDLRTGTWEVTLVRASCPDCREHLQRRRGKPRLSRTALVVLGPRQPWLNEYQETFEVQFRVAETGNVPIRTPQVVVVSNGRVIERRG